MHRSFASLRMTQTRLICEGGIFLVALGGKADVIELDFIDAGLGYEFGQSYVVVLDFGVRGIGPD